MAVASVTVSGTAWTPITSAGQCGVVSVRDIPFYWKKHTILLAEGTTTPTADTNDYIELFPTMGNNQYLPLVPDTTSHIFYARCANADDSTVILVDIY